MKQRFTILFFLLLLTGGGLFAASGGPDAYGYTWKDSNEPGGPVPTWIDTTFGAGWVRVNGLADDNSVGPFNSSWDFHFYWGDFRNFKIGSNGWIAFDNVSNIASCFPGIPTPAGAGDNYVAPLMSDLTFISSFPAFPNIGKCYYWSNLKDSLVISYYNVPFWQAGTPDWTGSNTFQILFDGTDSSITYNYLNMNSTFNNSTCLTDVVIGIENSTGAIGLESFREVMPSSNYAIKYQYPPTVLLSVKDLAPRWNQNDANAGEFYPSGLIPTLQSNVKNVGNANFTTSSTITGRLKTLALTTVYTGTRTMPTWNVGVDTTLVFSPQAIVNTAGQYYWEVTSSNPNDINAGNNVISSEIELVNLSGPTAQLTYTTGGGSTSPISWNGGGTDDGLGTYMIPPVYPVNINSVEVFIAAATSSGYIITIFDDNGPNGSPGTVLYSDTIPFSSVITNNWNTVTLSSSVTVNSGGFYVGWYMGGADISMGTEDVGPISRRSYEILGGAWSSYRDNSIRDPLFRVNIGGYPCAITAGFSQTVSSNTVSFSNQSTGGTSYVWDFGDGNSSTALSPTHTYSALGTYTVCLISTNNCGSDTICMPVTVTCPVPSAAFTSSATGITLQFTDASTTSPTAWFWDFGDGNSSTQQNPTHTYAAPGIYTVCLTVTNACGSDSSCTTISACNLPIAGFNSSVNGGTATFNNISSGGTTFIWDFGDGNTSTLQNPTHSYVNAGTYNVCLVTANACYSDTICQQVTVCPVPSTAFSFTANFLQHNFTDNTAGTNTAWLWDFGDGNTSSQQNPTHSYANAGLYTVCLTVTNACGTDSSCQTVNAIANGIESASQVGELKLWPNPASNLLQVEVNLDAIQFGFLLSIKDMTGKTAFSAKIDANSASWMGQLDVSKLASGMYMLEFTSADYKLVKKFVRN